MCFGVVGLQPFLVFCVFCLFTNTVFPLKTGYFVHFSVSPFLSPWFLSLLLFHSLSLSFLFFVFFSFLAFLFFCPSLFFCCYFLPCFFAFFCFTKKTTSNITFERFLFINYFCFWGGGVLFCFVFQIPFLIFCLFVLSVVCFVNINVFIFQRRPFLKHQVLFCALCKVIVFFRADLRANLVDVRKNTVKIGISAHD